MFLLKASFALLENLFTENLRTFNKKGESPKDWKEGLLNNLLRRPEGLQQPEVAKVLRVTGKELYRILEVRRTTKID